MFCFRCSAPTGFKHQALYLAQMLELCDWSFILWAQQITQLQDVQDSHSGFQGQFTAPVGPPPPSVLTINPCMSLLVPFSHFPPILCNSCSLSFSPGRDSLVQEIRAGAAKQLNKNGSYKRGALTLQRLTYIIPSL